MMSVSQSVENESRGSAFQSRLAFIFGVMSLAAGVVIGVGWGVFDAPLRYGLVAWAICTGSVLVAHLCGESVKQDHLFGLKLASSMAMRTVPPFAAVAWGIKIAQPPVESSFVFYILAFYMIGTITDVLLQVKSLSGTRAK